MLVKALIFARKYLKFSEYMCSYSMSPVDRVAVLLKIVSPKSNY